MNKKYPVLKAIFQRLTKEGNLHIVGGYVRDLFIGKSSNDIDFIVPMNAKKLGYKLSKEFNFPLVILDDERDIVRLIISSDLTLDFASYAASSLKEDLWARDVSINALALNVSPLVLEYKSLSELYPLLDDPTQGLSDLKSQTIRGLSRDNFISDPLRLLRVFRFAAQLSFKIEAETLAWVRELSPLINQVAQERVTHELALILRTKNSSLILKKMNSELLLACVLPGDNLKKYLISELQSVLATLEYHQSIEFTHLLTTYPQAEPYLTNQSSRDISKIVLIKIALIYIILFSNELSMSSFGEYFRLSRSDIKVLNQLYKAFVLFSAFQDIPSEIEMLDFFMEIQNEFWGVYLILVLKTESEDKTKAHLKLCAQAYIDSGNPTAHPIYWLNGKEIQERFNIRPGPQIGVLLRQLLEAQAKSLISSKSDAYQCISDLLSDNGQ